MTTYREERIGRAFQTASAAMNEALATLVEDGTDSPRLRSLTADWNFAAADILRTLAETSA